MTYQVLCAITVFICSCAELVAQIETRSLSHISERGLRVILAQGGDTIVAGDAGVVARLSNGRLSYLDVPGPESNIRAGFIVDSLCYLLESTGNILRVYQRNVVRVVMPERLVGFCEVGEDILAIGSHSFLRFNRELILQEKIPLGNEREFVLAEMDEEGSFGVTDDSTFCIIKHDGTVTSIKQLDETIERIHLDDDLVVASSSYSGFAFSRSRNREVSFKLQQAELDSIVAANGQYQVCASDRTSNRLLVHINPSFGNADRSPVYVCERSDTVLRVLHRYMPTDLNAGWTMSGMIALPSGELLCGDGGAILSRRGVNTSFDVPGTRLVVGNMQKNGSALSVLIGSIYNGKAKQYVRVYDSTWSELESVIREPAIDQLSRHSSHTSNNSDAVLFTMDTLFFRSIGSEQSTNRIPYKPKHAQPAPQLIRGLLISNSLNPFTRSIQVSSDSGRKWVTIPGNNVSEGGDGYVYSTYLGTIYRHRFGDSVKTIDSINVELTPYESLTNLCRTSEGILAFVQDNDQKSLERTHRFVWIRSGLAVSTGTLTTTISYRVLLPAVLPRDILFVIAGFGGFHWTSIDSGETWQQDSFDLRQLWPQSKNITQVHGLDTKGRILLGVYSGSIAQLSIDGLTSINEEPSIQWVAIRSAYPNPTEQVLNVTISSLPTADYLTWRLALYRLDGSLAIDCKPYTAPWTMTTTQQTISVPIHGLPSGMYYLASVNRGYAESKQIVVVR